MGARTWLQHVSLQVPRGLTDRLAVVAAASVPVAWWASGGGTATHLAMGAWQVTLALMLAAVVLVPVHRGLAARVLVPSLSALVLFGLPSLVAAVLVAVGLGVFLLPEWSLTPRRLLLVAAPLLGLAWHAALLEGVHRSAVVSGVLRATPLLFVAAAVLLAHVEVVLDPIEAGLRETRLHELWLQVAGALGRLPVGPERAQLQTLAGRAAQGWQEACDEATRLKQVLDGLAQDAASLAGMAVVSEDAEVRRQQEQLRRVEADTLEQVDGLRRTVERLHATASTQEAVLRRLVLQVRVCQPTPVALRQVHEQLAALTA
jgi:hypothetical protein